MKTNFIWPSQPEMKEVQPPMVYVREDPIWEYKHLTCKLNEEQTPTAAELNRLGAEGWELAGVFADSLSVHFYFKRSMK